MSAPKKNQFWKARSTHGRAPIFADPKILEDACEQYFDWADANPLIEARAFHHQGKVTLSPVPHMRAMTIAGLCLFLGISHETWSNYRDKKDFIGVTTWAEQIIYNQKFTGAAADMLNANIIARDLGLSDKKDHSSSDGTMSTNIMPVPTADSVEDWEKSMDAHTENMKG